MAQQLSGNDLQGWDGWIWIGGGSRVSGTSLTITGDYTAIISPGDRLKLTDTTTKYFYVLTPVTFSAGVTTLTITGGSDYSLVGTPSAISYSKMASPTGFPQWLNYTPTFAGWSVTPALTISRFCIIGRMCTVELVTTNTTSNATTATVTLPVAAAANSVYAWVGHGVDNGGDTLAMYALASSSATVTAWKPTGVTAPFGSWTATGTKGMRLSGFSYEF